MTGFRHWLFCTLFPDEAGTLMRYRLNIQSLDQWFCYHLPPVAEAAKWLKHYSEARDDPADPPSGMGISELRAKALQKTRPTRVAAGEYLAAVRFLRERECDLDGSELDALLRLFGLSLLP